MTSTGAIELVIVFVGFATSNLGVSQLIEVLASRLTKLARVAVISELNLAINKNP